MAFIPLFKKGMPREVQGEYDEWFFKLHDDKLHDIAWYRAHAPENWYFEGAGRGDTDFIAERPGIWRLGPALRERVREAVLSLQCLWRDGLDGWTGGAWERVMNATYFGKKPPSLYSIARWKAEKMSRIHRDLQELKGEKREAEIKSRTEWVQTEVRAKLDGLWRYEQDVKVVKDLQSKIPRSVVDIDRLAEYLCCCYGTSWELRDGLAEFQRVVLEMRGFLCMLFVLGPGQWPEPADIEVLAGTGWQDTAKRIGDRAYRGVFTRSAEVAATYARLGAPVWLVTEISMPTRRALVARSRPAARAHFEQYNGGQLDSVMEELRPLMNALVTKDKIPTFSETGMWATKPPQAYRTLSLSTHRSPVSLDFDLGSPIPGAWDLRRNDVESYASRNHYSLPNQPTYPNLHYKHAVDRNAVALVPPAAAAAVAEESRKKAEASQAAMRQASFMPPMALERAQDQDVNMDDNFNVDREVRGTRTHDARTMEHNAAEPAANYDHGADEDFHMHDQFDQFDSQPVFNANREPDGEDGEIEEERSVASGSNVLAQPHADVQNVSLKRKGAEESADEAEGNGEEEEEKKKKKKKKVRARRQRYTLMKEAKRSNHDALLGTNKQQKERAAQVSISSGQASAYIEGARPPFFPESLPVAEAATKSVDKTHARQLQLGLDAKFPVPTSIVEQPRSFRVPRASYFHNTWNVQVHIEKEWTEEDRHRQREVRVSRALYTMAQIWPFLLRKIEATPMYAQQLEEKGGKGVGGDNGVGGGDWRDLLKRRVPARMVNLYAQCLGLDVSTMSEVKGVTGKPDHVNIPLPGTFPALEDCVRVPHPDDVSLLEGEDAEWATGLFGSGGRSEAERPKAIPQDWKTCRKADWWWSESEAGTPAFKVVHRKEEMRGLVRWLDYDNGRVVWLPRSSRGMAQLGGERVFARRIPNVVNVDGEWAEADETTIARTTRVWPGLWEDALALNKKHRQLASPQAGAEARHSRMPIWLQTDVAPAARAGHSFLDDLGPPTWLSQPLPAWASDTPGWASPEWRRFMIWSVTELEFRHELFAFDLAIRDCHSKVIPEYQEENSRQKRYDMVIACWGGGSIVPGTEENILCSTDAEQRLKGLVAFRELMAAWPRAEALLPTWSEISLGTVTVADIGEAKLATLEEEVWRAYAQMHYDYRHHVPPMPYRRPALPFTPESSS
ncbi:hypothetical protein EXIGLDRAFT_781208 [Exidia glandulosa HHB12029]|uniref:Uncharacterized protein n=1 Tax=Exidia glandulosa HHB12029 TaxID=1314781 RepID=A0A165BBE9_EXIGL|nr:hypothetical protein EXIGLDRAFT_781208 [Exidia glandulosa HHB12029]